MSSAYDKYDYTKYWNGRNYEHECEVLVLQSFFEKIGSVTRALDVGGGFGRLIPFYNSYVKEVTLADPSERNLKTAKSKNIQAKLVRSTVEELPKKLKTGTYDVVLLVRVMHHLEDPKEAIKTLKKMLKKDGYLILEFANKMHGKAQLVNLLHGNFVFPHDIFPVDRRSSKNKSKKSIPFLNHHPDVMSQILKDEGFSVLSQRSVSNIRSRRAKHAVPMKILLFFEKLLQKPLALLNFGPSIFVLAKKTTKA